jgi:hypothetical protein
MVSVELRNAPHRPGVLTLHKRAATHDNSRILAVPQTRHKIGRRSANVLVDAGLQPALFT